MTIIRPKNIQAAGKSANIARHIAKDLRLAADAFDHAAELYSGGDENAPDYVRGAMHYLFMIMQTSLIRQAKRERDKKFARG